MDNSFKRKSKVPDKEREKALVHELHKKGHSHTDIAKCIERERKLFKCEPVAIGELLKEVEEILLEMYRRS